MDCGEEGEVSRKWWRRWKRAAPAIVISLRRLLGQPVASNQRLDGGGDTGAGAVPTTFGGAALSPAIGWSRWLGEPLGATGEPLRTTGVFLQKRHQQRHCPPAVVVVTTLIIITTTTVSSLFVMFIPVPVASTYTRIFDKSDSCA